MRWLIMRGLIWIYSACKFSYCCFCPFKGYKYNLKSTVTQSTPFSMASHNSIWATTWENRIFAYAKTKTQISVAVTVKLISAFVFATLIVQSLYFLNLKFQATRHPLWLYSPVCVRPGWKPRRTVFLRRGSYWFIIPWLVFMVSLFLEDDK